MSLKHFPFAGIGVLLIAVSTSPTVVGMIRAFNQLPGEGAATLDRTVALAFHPAMIACVNVGMLFVVIGIVRSCCCKATSSHVLGKAMPDENSDLHDSRRGNFE
ncbi:MAG: hypothetical protein WEB58_02695 [Planctomycetaceae bacterium]